MMITSRTVTGSQLWSNRPFYASVQILDWKSVDTLCFPESHLIQKDVSANWTEAELMLIPSERENLSLRLAGWTVCNKICRKNIDHKSPYTLWLLRICPYLKKARLACHHLICTDGWCLDPVRPAPAERLCTYPGVTGCGLEGDGPMAFDERETTAATAVVQQHEWATGRI